MSYTCYLDSCRAKESLPFVCNDCNQYFCRKHHPYHKHNCSSRNKSYRYVPEDLHEIFLCSVETCYKDDTESSKCIKCKKHYCDRHKYPWHKCINRKKSSWWTKFKYCFR